jgi:hypothetical protein
VERHDPEHPPDDHIHRDHLDHRLAAAVRRAVPVRQQPQRQRRPRARVPDAVLYLYQQFWFNGRYGYASAVAWALFLVIVIVVAVNFILARRIRGQEMSEQGVRQ